MLRDKLRNFRNIEKWFEAKLEQARYRWKIILVWLDHQTDYAYINLAVMY